MKKKRTHLKAGAQKNTVFGPELVENMTKNPNLIIFERNEIKSKCKTFLKFSQRANDPFGKKYTLCYVNNGMRQPKLILTLI